MRVRPRRVVATAAGLLIVGVVLAGVVAVRAVRRPWPQTDGVVTLGPLDASVDVYRDAFGVPHIYADTTEDLFAAQGYVHAQDRFWEMDVRRHTTAGRLSELFGASQVETDKVIRTLGWRRVAERELDLLNPESVRILEAYADGVNAYLRGRSTGEIALEYAVLGLQRPGYRPEPWTPVDSLAWLKAMAWDLRGNTQDELDRVAYSETLPEARVDELWPRFPFDLRESIVPDGEWPAARSAGRQPGDAGGRTAAEAGPLLRRLSRRLAGLPAMLGPGGGGLGSNSFVVAGDRTATGLPLLANDPHLGPALPSIWYQMALHCRTVSDACPYAVTGYSFSGLPGIVIGHNARIAWGFTNLGPDVTDFVLERVTDTSYEYAGQMLDLEVRRETIRVAGGDDVALTIRRTRHGPLLSDAQDSLSAVAEGAPAATGSTPTATEDASAATAPRAGPGQGDVAVALRWTALRPSTTFDALPALSAAGGWEDFRAAAALFDVPAQNMVYADVDGNIGYQAPGRIPIRAAADDGRWPAPGWTGEHDWQGFVAFEDMPWMLNPVDGFIVTANQPVIADGSGPFLSRDHAYGWRSQRLRDLLGDAQDLAPDDLVRLQFDARNGIAETLVPALTTIPVPDDVRAARDLLADWDLQQTAGSAPGAFFAGVWRHLLVRTFGDDLPPETEISGGGRWMEVVRLLADEPDARWWDDGRTERVEQRDDTLRGAMIDAHAELTARLGRDVGAWRWGDLHTLTLRHPTLGASGIAPIERIFNRGPLRVGGGPAIVDATAWTATEGYEVDWVPSMRMVVDLSDLDASRWIDLTGVSGHAFSDHYIDQAGRWADGDAIPMRWTRRAVEAAATDHLLLRPRGTRRDAR